MDYISQHNYQHFMNDAAIYDYQIDSSISLVRAHMAAHLAAIHKGAIIIVTPDSMAMNVVKQQLQFLNSSLHILEFPAWDCIAYDRLSPDIDIMAKRLHCLHHLYHHTMQDKASIIITSFHAVMQYVPPKQYIGQYYFNLTVGDTISMQTLATKLIECGFERVDTVYMYGQFALRGSIIDMMPIGYKNPIRLDFWGDDIETIQYFNTATQKRFTDKKSIASVMIMQVNEILLTPDTINNFTKNYGAIFGQQAMQDSLVKQVELGHIARGVEHYLPLFYNQQAHFFDYCHHHDNRPSLFMVANGYEGAWQHHYDKINDYYNLRCDSMEHKAHADEPMRPLPPDSFYMDNVQLQQHLSMCKKIISHNNALNARQHICNIKPSRDFNMTRDSTHTLSYYVKNTINNDSRKFIITCQHDSALKRVEALLDEADISYYHATSWKACVHKVNIILLVSPRTYEDSDYVIFNERNLFGQQNIIRPSASRRKSSGKKPSQLLEEVSALKEGDYVVHTDHGIAQYKGLEVVTINNMPHDCLTLLFAGNDKLFVPIEHYELISRYGAADNAICDKLGAASWQYRKAKAKKRIQDMAFALLERAALRQSKQHQPTDIMYDEYRQFCNDFPYEETEDQQKAINDIVHDLEQHSLMDRLVCGDVGFGKTEIAMRAAYIIARHGKQVAIICPTTLLARQHFKNFDARFAPYNINVGLLSRMVTPKQAALTKQHINDGTCHIIVGTHALLAKDISFHHLGLAIIDEEQHFGVKQKERIKELGDNTHLLTMTATPIPRTLQMALGGLRRLSFITTPPPNRIAVRTFVGPFDLMVIKEAVMRERFRNGQIFAVCPRISMIEAIQQDLQNNLDNIKIIAAHGQMPAADLDKRMNQFADGQYDMLLATNIIESGIDMPNVNTIIVFHADLFGLAQLYQLRGRVGRSSERAYCYYTWPTNRPISTLALKKLNILQSLDYLGAGFSLASHDMDIRGGGNLLGEEQSGHIKEIGIELYQKMLNDTVKNLQFTQLQHDIKAQNNTQDSTQSNTQDIIKNLQESDDFAPSISIDIPIMLPDTYIPDLNIRMALYQRLSQASEEDDIASLRDEMIDRFGAYPQEVDYLLRISIIKIYCRKASIEKLQTGSKGAIIHFRHGTFNNPEGLVNYITQQQGKARLGDNQSLILIRAWADIEKRLDGAQKIAKKLAYLNMHIIYH